MASLEQSSGDPEKPLKVTLRTPVQSQQNMEDEDDTVSLSSVESIIAPPDPIKTKLLALVALLAVFTAVELVLCCWYSVISGRASHYYNHPKSWQFCLIYSDMTISSYDQKFLDNVPTVLSNMGLQICLFSWLALAASWRALYHHEWIPSTIAFLLYNIFGILVYYQSTPLIAFPAAFMTSFVAVTKYLTDGLYDRIGKYCFMFQVRSGGGEWTNLYPELSTNCTDSIVLITSKLQQAATSRDKLLMIAESAMPESELNCNGATTLNYSFLIVNYFFVLVSVGLLVLMIHAEMYRRRHHEIYKQRYLIKGTHNMLKGTKTPKILLLVTAIGFVIEMLAKLDASLTALDSTKMWNLIDLTGDGATNLGGSYVDYRYDMQFSLNGWLPSKKLLVNLQTILIIVTTMSIVRGDTRQSVSAFRLATVSSSLFVIMMWPIILGNMTTMNDANLWPWQNDSECYDYFSGVAALYPSREQSKTLCTDTRLAVFGSLTTFISMNFTVLSCLRVFLKNKKRLSMDEEDLERQNFDVTPDPTPIYNVGLHPQQSPSRTAF